jgi:hypothetical protein
MLFMKNREDYFPLLIAIAFVPFVVSAFSLIINLTMLLPLLMLAFMACKLLRPFMAAKIYARSVIPSLRTEELNVIYPQRTIMDRANEPFRLRPESTKALVRIAKAASHITSMKVHHPSLPEPDKLELLSIHPPGLQKDSIPIDFFALLPKEINDDGLQLLAKQIRHVDNFIQHTERVAQMAMHTSPNINPGFFPLTVKRECKKLEQNNR